MPPDILGQKVSQEMLLVSRMQRDLIDTKSLRQLACVVLVNWWTCRGVTMARTNPATEIRIPANAQNCYEVSRADVPLSCPMPAMSLWNSHPKVYLPIEQQGGHAKCPYCGAEFELVG